MKKFNTTGVCIPSKHYMVDLSSRVEQIRAMVEDGDYFTINRARQYGKTTILNALRLSLLEKYTVISLDFQAMGNAGFASEQQFVQSFCRLIRKKKRSGLQIPSAIEETFLSYNERTDNKAEFDELFDTLTEWCDISEKPLILMIDEVDSATNNQVFLDFLAGLREGYILRDTEGIPTFHSVILAGVSDIKHLKSRIRDEDQHKVNSPWNIAEDFDVEMDFNTDDIAGMLTEYEEDHHTGMDLRKIAQYIEDYTSGYPFLVSRICQLIDEKLVPGKFADLSEGWTKSGVEEAVKLILSEKNTLFESLTGKLKNFPEMKDILRSMLLEGTTLFYNPLQESISQMEMYGFIRGRGNTVTVSNRIFETLLYNLFLSDEELKNNVFANAGSADKNLFIQDGRLNMRLILERFIITYHQIFGELTDRFKEKDGRELFLLYLKPIINGTGNYYIEAQTRTQTRTDIVVDYHGQQYVIEMKIWRGPRYNEEGEQQLREYLDYFNLTTGYMLSFNFNKKKETGVNRVAVGEKVLFEATL